MKVLWISTVLAFCTNAFAVPRDIVREARSNRSKVNYAAILSLSDPVEEISPEDFSNNFSPEFFDSDHHEVIDSSNVSSVHENSIRRCTKVPAFNPDVDATKVFPTLPFRAEWTYQKWFWKAEDFDFEERYRSKFHVGVGVGGRRSPLPSLKVFVVPHSHCDPGWLNTVDGYFTSQVKNILDLAVEKLDIYPNMTFVWNEISFLSLWWEKARFGQKQKFLEFVREGRLEVISGNWVMADEAVSSMYLMINQIVEGRQWLYNNLGISPTINWGIDQFGHGSFVPYLQKIAGVDFSFVQRLHYGWKKYLGQHELENFKWTQRWDVDGEYAMDTKNMDYDLYTTKHTCGPDPNVCLRVDFRNIMGEYSEYARHARPVRDINLAALAADLVGQFQRTASLGPSKTVLFLLGDDFRFGKSLEWDQQYENYVLLMNYINDNYASFGVKIQFGTVTDYVNEYRREAQRLPYFSGDFFPYSDIYSSARPAYWTGYYGTRPYWKKFSRETESELRSAEILYAYAINLASGDPILWTILRQDYPRLSQARKNVALFAHHDAITGTSRAHVMKDYGQRLFDAKRISLQIQRQSIRAIFKHGLNSTLTSLGMDVQSTSFDELPKVSSRVIYENSDIKKKVLLFNSLSFKRAQLVRVHVTSPLVKVVGEGKKGIVSQISPVFNAGGTEIVFTDLYELSFLAEMEPLSLHSYEIQKIKSLKDPDAASTAHVTCRGCSKGFVNGTFAYFEVENFTSPTIILGNGEHEVYLNGTTGFLERVTLLEEEVSIPVKLSYGGYKSVFRDSGAYLLKPDLDYPLPIPFNNGHTNLLMVEGPVTSYLTSTSPPLTVTTRIFKNKSQGIWLENEVDLQSMPGEIFMRFDTWLNSTTLSPTDGRQPTMFTDQGGFTLEKRVKVPSIGYEGNVYPVTRMAYIQDSGNHLRFSVLTDRAHGFNSMYPGRLETLIERRTVFDDGRGMSEGVTDNRRTLSTYCLMVERLDSMIDPEDPTDYRNNLPTLRAQHLSLGLDHPSQSFGFDDVEGGFVGKYSLLNKDPPQDSHLIYLRTLSNTSATFSNEKPSSNALITVQKLGHLSKNCSRNMLSFSDLFEPGTRFNGIEINSADLTDLAGINGVHYSGRRSTLPIVERKPFEITTLFIEFQQKPDRNIFGQGFNRNRYSSFRNQSVYEKA